MLGKLPQDPTAMPYNTLEPNSYDSYDKVHAGSGTFPVAATAERKHGSPVIGPSFTQDAACHPKLEVGYHSTCPLCLPIDHHSYGG